MHAECRTNTFTGQLYLYEPLLQDNVYCVITLQRYLLEILPTLLRYLW